MWGWGDLGEGEPPWREGAVPSAEWPRADGTGHRPPRALVSDGVRVSGNASGLGFQAERGGRADAQGVSAFLGWTVRGLCFRSVCLCMRVSLPTEVALVH